MARFIVEGGHRLSGTITPSGNKNEALPVLAALLLTAEPVVLHNVPRIRDIEVMCDLLFSLGVRITELGPNQLRFDAATLSSSTPEFGKASQIRGSFLLAAPLLVEFPGFSAGTSIVIGSLHGYDFFREVVEQSGSPATLDIGHLLSYQWLRGLRGEDLYSELDKLPTSSCLRSTSRAARPPETCFSIITTGS